MKATEILEVLSRENVSSGQFGILYLAEEMDYNYFVKTFLSSFYEENPAFDGFKLKGYVFYIWDTVVLDFVLGEDVEIHEIQGEYLHVIEVE